MKPAFLSLALFGFAFASPSKQWNMIAAPSDEDSHIKTVHFTENGNAVTDVLEPPNPFCTFRDYPPGSEVTIHHFLPFFIPLKTFVLGDKCTGTLMSSASYNIDDVSQTGLVINGDDKFLTLAVTSEKKNFSVWVYPSFTTDRPNMVKINFTPYQ